MKHEKIFVQHLERKAILYVRQSSAHQVLHKPREQRPAICHAGARDGAGGVEPDRNGR